MSRGRMLQWGFVLVFLFTVMLFCCVPVVAEMNVVGASWTVGEATTLTRLGDGVGKNPGADFNSIYPWSEMKLCNVANDGTIRAYIGDANFKRDGSNGQVMVKIPKFYYKHTYDDINKIHEFWVAKEQLDGFKLHPSFIRKGIEIPCVFVGAYEAGISSGKLTSISGVMPVGSKTRDQFRQLAQARGTGWGQIDVQTFSAIQLLYLIEYADTNCQEAIGAGIVNTSSYLATGSCDSLNGTSGIGAGDSVSYRGLENLWGNIWSFIDGINIKNNEKQPYIADYDFTDDKFVGNYKGSGISLPDIGGWYKDWAYSTTADWLLVPSSVGGSGSTYISDSFTHRWDAATEKVAIAGGSRVDGNMSGLFRWHVYYTSGSSHSSVGARIQHVPFTITFEQAQAASKKIAAGNLHSIVLKDDGSTAVWGSRCTNIPVTAKNSVVSVVSGLEHCLVIKEDDSAVAWGYNSHGQCNIPADITNNAIELAGAYQYSLALKSDGSVVSWGSTSSVPSEVQSGVVAISSYRTHSLALKSDGSVVAWGWNNYGQSTVPVSARSGVVAIAAGYYHSLALKSDGSVVAWGWNDFSQCTVPALAQRGVVAIAAGSTHSMALKSDGRVVAWGWDSFGKCTVPAIAQSGVVAIAAGGNHSLALKSDGSVVAWGDNSFGQCNVPADLAPTAKLANLTIDKGQLSPSFDSNEMNYTVDVANTVTSIQITATLENLDNLLTINGQTQTSGQSKTVNLVPGSNIIRIEVQAGDIIRTYTITVIVHGEAYLLAEWHLDEGTGVVAKDTSGKRKDGIVNEAIWVKGIKKTGLSFDGMGTYVSLPKPSLDNLSDWSIEAWVYPEGSGIIYAEGYPWITMQLAVTSNNALKIENWHSLRPGWDRYTTASNIITRNKWNHIVVTLKGGTTAADSGTINCYVNNKLVSTRGKIGGKYYSGGMPQAAIGINPGFQIGEHTSTFKGIIDEVAIYHGILTPEEIERKYNEPLFVKNLQLTSREDEDLTKTVLNGSFISKLKFDLSKYVSALEIGVDLPNNVKMEQIMAIKKDGAESDAVDVAIKGNKLIFSQGGQLIHPGNYEVEIFMFNDNILKLKTEYFSDSESNVNYPCVPFTVEIADLPDLL